LDLVQVSLFSPYRRTVVLINLLTEHFVLYQVTVKDAKNVFIGLQQGEAAYYQGTGNTLPAPEPWKGNLLPSDPDFSWCAANAVSVRIPLRCRMVAVAPLQSGA